MDHAKYSERGPVPRPLNMGDGLVDMLLCLQEGQELIAPRNDLTETVFTVLEGHGFIMEDEQRHAVEVGDVVHILAGSTKALIAGEGTFTVLGTRRLKGKADASG
jgi:quercetin dioxygenase-like cupin family protein